MSVDYGREREQFAWEVGKLLLRGEEGHVALGRIQKAIKQVDGNPDLMLPYKVRELASLMSAISQDGYCASWMVDLEKDLWRIVKAGYGEYGSTTVTPREAQRLEDLSDEISGWVVYGKDGAEFIPKAEWLALYGPKPRSEKPMGFIRHVMKACYGSSPTDETPPFTHTLGRPARITYNGQITVTVPCKVCGTAYETTHDFQSHEHMREFLWRAPCPHCHAGNWVKVEWNPEVTGE